MTDSTAGPVFRPFLSGDPPAAFVVTGIGAGLTEMLADLWMSRLKQDGRTAELTHLTPLDLERESATFTWRTPSFFASPRLFLLPDLADLKKAARDEIAAYLKEPSPQVILFVPCSKKDAISGLKFVKKVELGPMQVESVMAGFAGVLIRDSGRTISPKAATFLARWIGADFPRFREEIGKLVATFEAGREIGEKEIREACVAGGYEMDPFKFAEAIIARNREQVITMFRRFSKEADRDEYYKLLGAISWKVRASGGSLTSAWASKLIEALGEIDRGLKGESELSPEQFVEIRLLKLLS